jgi:uncharacterized Zn finger protein (UPF0148 family)
MIKNYHCPRCKSTNLIWYKDTVECPNCHLEFYIKDLERYMDNQILSKQEKSNFVKSFKK